MQTTSHDVEAEYKRLVFEFAHHIRSPLQALFSCSAILEKSPADSLEFQWAVGVIVRNLRVQAELIEDLLRAAA